MLILAGCSSTPTVNAGADKKVDSSYQMRIGFLPADSCPVTRGKNKESAVFAAAGIAIAAEVAGKVVGNAVDALGDYLSKDQAISYKDNSRMDGFAKSNKGKAVVSNDEESCMIIVIAKDFGTPKDNAFTSYFADPTLQSASPDINKATGVNGPLALYLEARIKFSGGEGSVPTAFTFVPVYWYYPQFITPDSWRFGSERDVLLRAELSTPGTATPFGLLEMQWTAVKSGGISSQSVVGKKLPWSPLPQRLTEAATKVTSESLQKIYPVNVNAIFTETAKPYVLLKYTGDALKNQKATLSNAAEDTLTQAFSQQARITARQAALGDIEKRYNDYSTAYDNAAASYTAYEDATGVAKTKALAKARFAYEHLDNSKATLQAAYNNAGMGSFDPLPELTPLPRP
jgi:hypothetical protein